MEPIASFKPNKGRDKLYIIATILEIARDGSLKTQIMYRANLSFTQLNDYLRFMLKISLLERILQNDRETYRATEKGIDFLQRYREIHSLMSGESSEYQHQSSLLRIKSQLGDLQKTIANLEAGLFNMVSCPKCQESIFFDYRFCPYCGTRLPLQAIEGAAE
jgi:predicted transcriptional regulator